MPITVNEHGTASAPRRESPAERLRHRRYAKKRRRKLRNRRPHRLSPAQRRAVQRLKATGFYKKLARFRPRAKRHESHDPAYILLVAEAAAELRAMGVDEGSVASLVADFTNRDADTSNTPAGLSSLMLEAVIASNDELFGKFLDTEVEDDSNYFAVFTETLTAKDLRWLMDAAANCAESVEVVLEKGQLVADGTEMVSDYTVVAIVAKKEPYLQPDDESGMTECQLEAAYDLEEASMLPKTGGKLNKSLRSSTARALKTQRGILGGYGYKTKEKNNNARWWAKTHIKDCNPLGRTYDKATGRKQVKDESVDEESMGSGGPPNPRQGKGESDGQTVRLVATFHDRPSLLAAHALIDETIGVLATHTANKLSAVFRNRDQADECAAILNTNFRQKVRVDITPFTTKPGGAA